MNIYKNFKYTQVDSGSFLSSSYISGYPFERGYFVEKNELKLIVSSSLIQLPFGNFEDERVEFSVYDSLNQLVKWKRINPSGSIQAVTRSYYDILNANQGYSYDLYTGDFLTIHGSTQFTSSISASMVLSGSASIHIKSDELVVSPINDLLSDGLGDGSYGVAYTLVKDIVGSSHEDDNLIIKQISPDRTEIVVVPQHARTDLTHKKLITEYYTFANKAFKVKDIIPSITDNLKYPQLPQIFNEFVDSNTDLVTQLKFVYSFIDDISLLNFTSELFAKIKDQYENTLFASYESSVKFSELSEYYNNVCSYVIDKELKRINRDLPEAYSENYILYVAFFYNIYYKILDLNTIESNLNKRFYSFLRNYVNFGKGNLNPIVTWSYAKLKETIDIDQNYPIIFKLRNPLHSSIKLDDKFWISNLVSSPRIFNVTISKPLIIKTKKLKGPNFFIPIENVGESTKTYNFDQLVASGSGITDKIITYINQNYFDKNLNVDYTKLEEFVHFSTATDRLQSYDEKVNQLTEAEAEITRLDSYISQSYNVYYESEKLTYLNQINSIKSNFDGYENFLYYSPLENGVPWRDIHWTSASLYDEFNDDSLVNNTPREIIENGDNADYKKFLSMIGHHFDLIYSYIKNFPSAKFAENDPNTGVAQNMIYHVLSSFGFDPYSGHDAQDLWLSLFGDSPDNSSTNMMSSGSLESMSGQDRTKTIWRRILNNFSYIVKTKGTEESIRALMTCYGVPKYLFKIREYGGIEYTTDLTQDSLFIYDSNNYFLRFTGSAEYVKTPWYDDIQTVEFKVSFNQYETSPDGSNYRLGICDSNWAVGFLRETGSWGRGYFTITDDNSNIRTLLTDMVPVFNGDIFSVMLRKNDINPRFDIPVSASVLDLDLVPTQYDLIVKRAEDERFVFDVSGSMILSGSHNTYFRSGSNFYFGNYSISNPTELFYGNLDQLRLWGTALSTERFNNHAMFVEAYDTDNPYETVQNLFVKVDFDYPTNLYTTSSFVYIPNTSYNQTRVTNVEAYNFISSSDYPYNFTLFESRETVKIPNFGSNKFRSNKIRVETQELVAPLSAKSRSTLKSRDRQPSDSNGLGVFFSPVDLIDTDILRFFGEYNLSDFIGDPSDLYKKNYNKFNKFREVYFRNGGGNIDFQSYINLVKAYFDKSMFRHLDQLAPARSSFKSGLLIEPSLLERSKIENKPTEREIHNNVTSSIYINDVIHSQYVHVPTSSIQVFDREHVSLNNNYLSSLYAPLDEYRSQIHADPTGLVTRTKESGSVQVFYYKAELLNVSKSYEVLNDNGSIVSFSSSFETINLIPLGVGFTGSIDAVPISPNGRVLKGYPTGHYKFRRDFLGRKSIQTQNTTVDETGLLNNSLPFERRVVDRTVVQVEGYQSATILGTT